MKRTVVGTVLLMALLAVTGPVATASSRDTAAVAARGDAVDEAVTPAAPVRAEPVGLVVDAAPARTAPRRPHPVPLAVVSVPFVCQVHLAEEGDASDASD